MNSISKNAVVKEAFKSTKGECLFLQETKMEVIEIRSVCIFHDQILCFILLKASLESRDILLVWNSMFWRMLDVSIGFYSVLYYLEMFEGMLSGWLLLSMDQIFLLIRVLFGQN